MTKDIPNKNIIAFTGHRPNKLGGYGSHIHNRLVDLAKASIVQHKATLVISGMALGWDTAVAEAAILLGIPFYAAIPFEGQENRWPKLNQDKYHSLLLKASSVKIIGLQKYFHKAMQDRNKYMVDHCDLLLALWDGSKGGTYNCISYARSKKKKYINLWNSWQKFK